MTNALALANFNLPAASGSIDAYIQAANRVPLLTEAEELSLARRLRDENDLDAARQLVTSHLRLVIAIARGKDKEPLARQLGAAIYIDSQSQDPAAELLRRLRPGLKVGRHAVPARQSVPAEPSCAPSPRRAPGTKGRSYPDES